MFIVLIFAIQNSVFLDNSQSELIMEKTDIQKLVDSKSERLVFERSKGKSAVWKHFQLISLDNVAVPFVKCDKCHSLLKWKSRDGTSGLTSHIEYCGSQVPQTKLTSLAGFSSVPSSTLPAAVKSDVADAVVTMCAKDIRYVIHSTVNFIRIQPVAGRTRENVDLVAR